jgi:DNA-binding NarL/FixJ family response regulator
VQNPAIMAQHTATSDQVAVLIVDDNQLFAHGLRAFLDADERIRVVAVAASGKAALAEAIAQQIDVALVDIHLIAESGVDIVRMLTTIRPEIAAIAVSGVLTAEDRRDALAAGAIDVLEKDELVRVGRNRVAGAAALTTLAASRGDAA